MAEQVLICPECGEEVHLQDSELVVGYEVRCLHCSADLYLSHFSEFPEDPPHWQLESYSDYDELDD